MTEKPCSKCGVVKPIEEFYVALTAAGGRTPYCRKCKTAATMKRYHENRVKREARKAARLRSGQA